MGLMEASCCEWYSLPQHFLKTLCVRGVNMHMQLLGNPDVVFFWSFFETGEARLLKQFISVLDLLEI